MLHMTLMTKPEITFPFQPSKSHKWLNINDPFSFQPGSPKHTATQQIQKLMYWVKYERLIQSLRAENSSPFKSQHY